jgi:hypothetical protein
LAGLLAGNNQLNKDMTGFLRATSAEARSRLSLALWRKCSCALRQRRQLSCAGKAAEDSACEVREIVLASLENGADGCLTAAARVR